MRQLPSEPLLALTIALTLLFVALSAVAFHLGRDYEIALPRTGVAGDDGRAAARGHDSCSVPARIAGTLVGG